MRRKLKFALDLDEKPPFSVLAFYKYFRKTTKIEALTMQLRNMQGKLKKKKKKKKKRRSRRNFKKAQETLVKRRKSEH